MLHKENKKQWKHALMPLFQSIVGTCVLFSFASRWANMQINQITIESIFY